MDNESTCFFCGSECETHAGIHNVTGYDCPYCGQFLLSKIITSLDSRLNDPKTKFNIACILNERRLKGLRGVAISKRTGKDIVDCGYAEISVDDILDAFPREASDFLNRTLLNLSRIPERPFDVINLDFWGDIFKTNYGEIGVNDFYAIQSIISQSINFGGS